MVMGTCKGDVGVVTVASTSRSHLGMITVVGEV